MQLKLKTLTVSLLALGLSTAIFAKPVLQQSYKQIEEYKLDNGLKVILFENNKESKVFINMIYQTGSLNDPNGKGGMAHLLEHLAFKGTQNIKGDDFQKRLDQYTLSNNASTDYYVTQYTNEVRADQKAIDEVIYLEAERMDKLVLQQKFVPSEIEIVKRERELTSDQPFSLLIDKVFKAIYGNKDLGREPIGDLGELQSINMTELNQFYRKWYAPNNAVMVITGNFDKTSLLNVLDQKFSTIPARKIPDQTVVPVVDLTKIKDQYFSVQKGSSYQKMNIYITPRKPEIEPILSITPLLFNIEPSGQLYKNMVDTGIVDDATMSPWITPDFNLMIVSADYAPSQNVKKIDKSLITSVEQFQLFNDVDLSRVKTVFKNSADADFKDATKIGELLSDSVALNKGNWIQYFQDREVTQKLDVNTINQQLRVYFKPDHRISSEITPTSKSEKKVMQADAHTVSDTLMNDADEKPQPLKNVTVYKKEIAHYLQDVIEHSKEAESEIVRGKLNNGLQYALYSTSTLDDQSYANLVVNFGTAESLFNKGEVIDLTAYLMMRGSDRYSLQDITDKSIEADGEVLVVPNGNSIEFRVSADKAHFSDYLKFVLELIKTPTFDKSQFNQIKTKSLNRLDRSYTEPETVATFAMSKLVNQYPEGDLRGFSSPEFSKKSINKVTNEQIKSFYKKYFNMHHAQIAVTGEINPQQIKALLETELSSWNGQEDYAPIGAIYQPVKAQKHHLLAEQREFGYYKANLAIAMGADSPDTQAMYVLSYILGESQLSSRLGQELREKNTLVYGFNESVTVSDYEDSGYLEISANYTAGKSELVSRAVHKVLNDLLKNGVTEQEVEAAKADLLKQSATGLENASNIHELLAPQLKHNRNMSYLQSKYQHIAKVTKTDVDAVIQKYIKLDQLVEVMADQYGKDVK